jgi:hypothetical protein
MSAVAEFAPLGEDHLLRSTSVVREVTYASGRIDYQTFDRAATEVLRLSFQPAYIMAGGVRLAVQDALKGDTYTVRPLPGGDFEVHVRHLRSAMVSIRKS